jgi:uncharacterized membrane protein YfcA
LVFPVPAPEFALAAIIIVGAYFVFGISAFGSGLFAIPFLTHLWPLSFVLPIMVLLDCVASGSVAFRQRHHAAWRELAVFLPITFIGLITGVALLVHLPPVASMGALGATVVVFGLWALAAHASTRPVSRLWALPAGFASGVASGAFGVGGPPSALYLSGRVRDKTALRATLATTLVLSVVTRIALFGFVGLMTPANLVLAAALLPFAFAGLWAGGKVHLRLSREQFSRFVAGLVIVSGISLVIRAALL